MVYCSFKTVHQAIHLAVIYRARQGLYTFLNPVNFSEHFTE